MYYKITNKNSKVYKKLFDQRTNEKEAEEANIKEIKEKTGLDFKNSFGNHGQQNFNRVTSYAGFEFTEPDKVDLKIWKRHSEHQMIFVPNKKTKLGREMSEFLLNGLKGFRYDLIFELIGVPELIGRFKLPFVEICKNEVIVVFLDDEQEPKDKDVIEITKKEFYELLKK